jgi:hypothetical protein
VETATRYKKEYLKSELIFGNLAIILWIGLGIIITKTTALTQEKIAEIAGYIRAGNFTTVACQLAGVPECTYYHWRERGKEPNNLAFYKNN